MPTALIRARPRPATGRPRPRSGAAVESQADPGLGYLEHTEAGRPGGAVGGSLSPSGNCKTLGHRSLGAGAGARRRSPGIRLTGRYGTPASAYSGLIPANFTTLPHFSVSSAIIFPKSAGDIGAGTPPSSLKRAFILGSASPALISLFSLSTISADVLFGAP